MSDENETKWVHADNWTKWLGGLAGKPGVVGVEIGTFEGESAEWALKNVFNHPESFYYCIDPFTGNPDQIAAGIDFSGLEGKVIERLRPYRNAIIINGYSNQVVRWMKTQADFVYIDGSHYSRDVLRDSVLAFEILKVGGVLIWDDISWGDGKPPLDGPRMAIESFVRIYSRHLVIIGSGWQVAATKTSE